MDSISSDLAVQVSFRQLFDLGYTHTEIDQSPEGFCKLVAVKVSGKRIVVEGESLRLAVDAAARKCATLELMGAICTG